jgi:hypothetical protein
MTEQQQQQPQQKPPSTGKVGRGVNMGLDVGYAIIWSLVALLGIACIFTPAHWWGLLLFAIGAYFAGKNVLILVRLRGRD